MLPEASLRLPIGRNLHFVLLQFPRRRLAFLLMLKLFSTHVSIGSTLSKERLHLIGEFEGEEEQGVPDWSFHFSWERSLLNVSKARPTPSCCTR